MKKVKKILLIVLSVLFVACVFSGCGEEKSFAWGLERKDSLFAHRSYPHCAVSGDSRTFEKDDVTFNLHYGSQVVWDWAELDEFYISVYDENEKEYRLKTIRENILSEKYKVTTERKGRRKFIYHFSHSETITVPVEVFDIGNSFKIEVGSYKIASEDGVDENAELPHGLYGYSKCTIKFKVKDNKVIFTDYEPKDYK